MRNFRLLNLQIYCKFSCYGTMNGHLCKFKPKKCSIKSKFIIFAC